MWRCNTTKCNTNPIATIKLVVVSIYSLLLLNRCVLHSVCQECKNVKFFLTINIHFCFDFTWHDLFYSGALQLYQNNLKKFQCNFFLSSREERHKHSPEEIQEHSPEEGLKLSPQERQKRSPGEGLKELSYRRDRNRPDSRTPSARHLMFFRQILMTNAILQDSYSKAYQVKLIQPTMTVMKVLMTQS